MKSTPIEQIFETQLQTLALTLRPNTMKGYRSTVRSFLACLRVAFPHQVRRFSQLRRDPHLLGWFRALCEHHPSLRNVTRIGHLIRLRRLLDDLAANGHPLPSDLVRREDFPPQPRYLPRALSIQEDQLLQQELRRTDDLPANALLLTRAIGIRIGECIDLPLDCLRQLGPNQWALHVPLGKLHNDRLVPADDETRRIVEGSSPCAPPLRPPIWRIRKACCCHAPTATTSSIKPFTRLWCRQLSELVAPAI